MSLPTLISPFEDELRCEACLVYDEILEFLGCSDTGQESELFCRSVIDDLSEGKGRTMRRPDPADGDTKSNDTSTHWIDLDD